MESNLFPNSFPDAFNLSALPRPQFQSNKPQIQPQGRHSDVGDGQPTLVSMGTFLEEASTENIIYSATRPTIGNAVRTGVDVYMKTAVTDKGVPQDALKRMLTDLYKVPEIRPILDVAAWMVDNTELKIELINKKDQGKNTDGEYSPEDNSIWIEYDDKEDGPRSILMHEITHAVAYLLYNNDGKTYRPWEKEDYLFAIENSRNAEAVSCSELKRTIANSMNGAFIDRKYDHHKEWESERGVRIPELLGRDYHSKAVLQEKYAMEWEFFNRFTDDCIGFLSKERERGGISWELRAFDNLIDLNNKPLQGSLETCMDPYGVAKWAINLAVMKAFGNVRGAGHSGKVMAAAWQLADIFKASCFSNFLPVFAEKQLEDFAISLSAYYKKCFTRSIWTHKRQYHFKKIDEKVLQKLRAQMDEQLRDLCIQLVLESVVQSQNGIAPDAALLHEALRAHPFPSMLPHIWHGFIKSLATCSEKMNGKVPADCIDTIVNECITMQIHFLVAQIQFSRPDLEEGSELANQLCQALGEEDLRSQLMKMDRHQWQSLKKRLEEYYIGREERDFPKIGNKKLRGDLSNMIENNLNTNF